MPNPYTYNLNLNTKIGQGTDRFWWNILGTDPWPTTPLDDYFGEIDAFVMSAPGYTEYRQSINNWYDDLLYTKEPKGVIQQYTGDPIEQYYDWSHHMVMPLIGFTLIPINFQEIDNYWFNPFRNHTGRNIYEL